MVTYAMSIIGATRIRPPRTPLEKSAAPAAAPAPPPPPEPPDLDTLPRDLLKGREMAFAVCMSLRMEAWLAHHIAALGIPRDNCTPAIDLLPIYVEAWLKACILFPELLPRAEPDDDDEPEYVATEGDAIRAGLTVVARRRPGKHKPVPTLPGCRGLNGYGTPCAGLRRAGDAFCPACTAKERKRMREEV